MRFRFSVLFFRRLFYSVFILLWLFILLPYLFPLYAPQQSFSEKPFPESRFIKSRNNWVHYRIFMPQSDSIRGKVMLIHGFSGSTYSWRKTIPALQKAGYFVCAIDLPPFGFSDKRPHTTFSDSAWTSMIREVMDSTVQFTERKSEKWILAGHSMGGMVIGAFATRFPEKVRALVYVDGTSPDSDGVRSPGLKLTSAFFRQGFVQRWSDVFMEKYLYSEKRFRILLRSAYGQEPEPEEVRAYMEPFGYRYSTSAVVRFASCTGYARVERSVLQHIPRMLIWGKNDKWIPIDGAMHFLGNNPDVQSFFIENAGHCPMETHSEIFNSALLGFINDL